MSHNYIEFPSPSDAMRLPSIEKQTENTGVFRFNGVVTSPLIIFHNLIVLSSLPETNDFPSFENAIDNTAFSCPVRVDIFFSCFNVHNLTVLSLLPDTRFFPSGEKHTEYMALECP